MSMLRKDHIVGAGAAALAAGATGAAIGAVIGGPAGLAVGAVAGGALGAVLGDRATEAVDRRGDLGHFKQIYHTMPYFIDGMGWEDYAPAYRYGLDTYRTHGARAFADAETGLQAGWPHVRETSRLSWMQARDAIGHTWRELEQTRHLSGT